MGVGNIYKCPKCGKDKKLFLGIGMLYMEDNLLNSKSGFSLVSYCNDTVNLNEEELTNILDNDCVSLEEAYGNEIYVCPKCGAGEVHFKFVLHTKNHGDIIPKYKCNRCDSIMKSLEKEDYKLYCDDCGSEIPTKGKLPMMIMWD